MRPTLVLASSSPRRRHLLIGLNLDFTCRPVEVDEEPFPDETPEAYVERLASEKATAQILDEEIVLAADTIVEVDGALLGKPATALEAAEMLRRLSGRTHRVLTGVAIGQPNRQVAVDRCESAVTVAPLEEHEISWYVDTGEPRDKAGAYAIQGLGALFVERIDGNYSNVVGLPLPTVYRLFRSLGLNLLDFSTPATGRSDSSSRT